MLNNIRGILNRRGDQSRTESLSSRPSEENVQTEGFVCPTCFLAFPTAETLQNHYESSHSETFNETAGDRPFNCPACKMKLGSEVELQSHFTRHHTEKKEDIEFEAMSLQVKALEEGKTLLQTELQAVREELLKENMKIREERDSFKLKANKLTDDLASLKLQFDDIKANKISLENALRLSKEKIKDLEIEVHQRPAADDVAVLKQEIVTVQKLMNEMTRQSESQKEDLQKKCNDLQDNYLKLQAEKLELENFIKNCPKKEEYSSLQKKLSEMSSNVSNLQRELNAKEIEKNKLQTNLDKVSDYEQIKASLLEKNSSLEENQRISAEKETVLSQLKEEIKVMKEKIKDMKKDRENLFSKIQDGEGASAAMHQLKEENTRLQEQLMQQQNIVGQNATKSEEKLVEMRALLKRTNQDLQEASKKCSLLQTSLDDVQCQIKILENDKESLLKEIEINKETSAADKAEIRTLKQELEKKDKTLEMKTHQVENLSQQLKDKKSSKFYVQDISLSQSKKKHEIKESTAKFMEQLKLEKQNLESKLTKSNQTLTQIQTSLSEKEKEYSQIGKLLQEKADELNVLVEEKQMKEHELDQMKESYEAALTKVNSLEAVASEFEASKEEFCSKISSLNEELVTCRLAEADLNAALENMSNLKNDITEKCQSLEDENKTLRQSVTTLQNEKNSLLNEIEEGKKSLSDMKETCNELSTKVMDITEMCEKEKSNCTKIRNEANLEKDHYIKDKLNLQKQIESLENDCAKQLSQNQETIKKLENQIEELEEKSAILLSSLDETKQTLQQRESDIKEKEAQHVAKVDVFTQNIKILREDLSAEQKKRESLEQKYDEICGTKYELDAKLENAISERNTLLERCVKSEKECERLQKNSVDVQRKYNDCVAALQELGRENQTLQVENMKHITRKWADDSEVTHCTACGKLFTVTIRKHHCRNCGNIFCNECSAKSATVASSKKPVRVCDVCFVEVTK